MDARAIDPVSAETYARWFRALADPTRIRILNLLACSHRPMSVGEVTAAVGVEQPTVSHHLKVLREVGFAKVERVGTFSMYRVNERCLAAFPAAADVVMGIPARQGTVDGELTSTVARGGRR